ncbi:phage tail tape measure protein [Leucobacter sp. NPDC015123]|uniref:phage tail tape measure protein n=1 Tax=Leucobacter sp. NPDC015123 TaxID=3364129 RepID=UPI0036F4A907
MADRSVKVVLTAQVAGYIAGMEKAAKATRDTGSEAEKLAQTEKAFETMGRASMVAGGAMAAGLALSTKAAIDWDSAWAGVTKTVDGSPEQLAEVEAGLRGLSKVLPAAHGEIAAVAEAAGQLGIATPNVVEFTKTMIDLGETTNLSAEEAATQLARFVNVMGTSQSQVSNLGAALVELGNNYATTEAEILSMAQRLSGAGVQIGMSEGQVLGLSTALSSVGIEAEAGGSAMSKVMIDIASSVDKGGERLGQFADVSGMSAQAFAAQWRNDPGEALASFVKGLANAEAQGKSTFGILEELGISEVRMRDALLRSASAADQFSAAMATGNEAFLENTALVDEANKRYETTAAKLGMMRNRVVDAAISLGEHFLPAIEFVADGVGAFADLLSGLDGPMGAVVAWGGLLASGFLLAGGAALIAVPKIAAFKVSLSILEGTMASVSSGASRVIGFLGNPWVLGVTAAASVIGILVSEQNRLSNQAKALADTLDGATGAITENSEAWAANELQQQGILSAAKRLGVGADDMTQAWLGNAEALQVVNDRLDKFRSDADFRLENADWKGWSDDLVDVGYALDGSNKVLSEAKTRHDELAEATGKSTSASEESVGAVEDQTGSLSDLASTAGETQEAIAALADEIRGYNDPIFDMREANRQLEDSLLSLSDSLGENGNNFDISSEAGRKNEAALDAVAEATNRAAASVYEATGDQAAMNAKLEEGRQKLTDILAPYFSTRDAAAAYVDQLNLISPEKVTKFVADTADARANVDAYIAALSAVQPVVGTVLQITERVTRQLSDGNADGGMYAYADGGIAAYADGGFASGIYKGGTPIHKFAEPETIWEAYISGKPDQRDRNRQIWQETGRRLGMDGVGTAVAPVVYVQNPFTGEYLLAKAGQVADAKIDGYATEQARAGRMAGY